MRILMCLLIILAAPVFVHAATLNVPGQYPNIQVAINATVNGDTVLVAPGIYLEIIDFKGKAISLKSEQGAGTTVIDGNQAGSVVTCRSGEGADSILQGFTLTNGSGTLHNNFFFGGGMFILSSSPTVKHCIFSRCTPEGGGGIYSEDSSMTVFTCMFSGCQSSGGGGGISIVSPTISNSPTLSNCIFINNSAGLSLGGGICIGGWAEASTTVINCLFINNNAVYGGGIRSANSCNTMIQNCTFIGNNAGHGGAIDVTYLSTLTMTNCILWNNIYEEINGGPKVTYSNVRGGYPGTGNIDVDPLLIAGPQGFSYLSQMAAGQPSDSPCVDAGSDLASNLGMDAYWTRTDDVPDSGIVDMGFHYGSSFLFPALQADSYWIPENTGGHVDLLLVAGAENANRNYILLGNVSSRYPGTPLPGGNATLPINWDAFTSFITEQINTPVFSNFLGKLDSTGSAMATFDTLTPVPGVAKQRIHFAYALNNPWDFASNSVRITIIQ